MSKFWQKKYISKHTGAEIDEAVEAVLDGDVGTKVVANPTLAGTEPDLTGLQVGDDKFAVGGMTEAEGDLRYLKLAGGDLTGNVRLPGLSGYGLQSSEGYTIFQASSDTSEVIVGGGNKNYTSVYLTTGANGHVYRKTSNVNYEILDKSMGLPVLTTAPAADNTDGIKIVVLSSEPATKYNGYLYIITA